jgi:sortase A
MSNKTTSKDKAHHHANDAAVNLIRSRISAIHNVEPVDEPHIPINATTPSSLPISKHQKYMQELNASGKTVADIQTAWHEYYQKLSDIEKHEVWQEFYKARVTKKHSESPQTIEHPPKHGHVYHEQPTHQPSRNSIADLKKKILSQQSSQRKKTLSAVQNFKSLLFGLGMGAAVLLILSFSFFNERFIAPFITPSKNVSSTPIVIDSTTTAAGPEPLIIIPKINVEVPVVYDVDTIDEPAIQAGLERGVVHYATTSNPGEQGNSVIVGHSSNNLFNRGKYKFAFVLLNRLEVGDTLSLTKNSKRYVYKIYEKKIVPPTDLSVLGPTDKPATVTLITCDPPGTAINRLIVRAEQVSPDPVGNIASTAKPASGSPTIVPGNAPSLWSRLVSWFNG